MRTDLQIIKPRHLFDVDINKLIRNTREAVSKDIAVDLNVTAQTWKNSPKARIDAKSDGEAEIYMLDQRYMFVNDGTRPHKIRPRNASRLVFPANYRAKTIVRSVSSRSGGSFGPTVYAVEVQHPGTQARHFDEEIAKKWNRLLPNIVDRMILSSL